MGKKSALFILLFFVSSSQSLTVYNIDSWHVTLNSLYTDTAGVNGIYTIGVQLGMIPENLYFEITDSDARWLAFETWLFNHTFEADNLLSFDHINLVFDGIDAISNITLNGVQIGTTSNMFLQYVFNVKPYLQSGSNILQVIIQSPLEEANSRYAVRPYRIPPECPPKQANGNCHVNMLRKMQASFSWDWGPSIPSAGVWKPAYLEAYNDAIIRYLVTDVQSFNETFWVLNVDVYFSENPTDNNRIIGTLYTKLEEEIDGIEEVNITINDHGEYVFGTSYYVNKSKVNAWWPNGYGEQTLYAFQVSFQSSGKQNSAVTNRIGFRTIELVQEKIEPNEGSQGLSFYFRVNGVPIFMKGSNWIPVDLRPELGQDRDKIQKLLSAAKWANMNMLRIWGGGVYESDILYELADEMGILLWQDFMFACALYPTDATFLDSVKEEVRQQIKRIHSHPSVAAWSGNNENEGALMDNWWHVDDKTPYISDYVKLYITTVKTEFDRLTHNRGIFLSSSPSNGLKTEEEGWLSDNVGNNYFGDVHYYNYVDNPFDPEIYPIPRFCSEYGYQSLPSIDSFLEDTEDFSNLYLNSTFMNYRQHHPDGNTQILDLIESQMELPSPENNYIEAVIYYSQILQAFAYKTETEHYRKYRSILASDGRGNTMGALYWQLNDVWTAPTWSSIDFYGRWKMSHYFARNFFSDVIVTASWDNHRDGVVASLNIYAVTDTQKLPRGWLIVELMYWNGTYCNANAIEIDAQDAGTSRQLYVLSDLTKYMHGDIIVPASDVYIALILTTSDRKVRIAENYVFLTPLKDANLPQPTVNISAVAKLEDAKTFNVTVSGSDGVALFVWLDSHSILGHFSDNGFLLSPGDKNVTFYGDSDTSVEDLQSALTVTHFRDQKFFP